MENPTRGWQINKGCRRLTQNMRCRNSLCCFVSERQILGFFARENSKHFAEFSFHFRFSDSRMSIPLVISSVTFKNNPAKWTDPFQVEVIFEAREDLGKRKLTSGSEIFQLLFFSNGISICVCWICFGWVLGPGTRTSRMRDCRQRTSQAQSRGWFYIEVSTFQLLIFRL